MLSRTMSFSTTTKNKMFSKMAHTPHACAAQFALDGGGKTQECSMRDLTVRERQRTIVFYRLNISETTSLVLNE